MIEWLKRLLGISKPAPRWWLTRDEFRAAMLISEPLAQVWYEPIRTACLAYDIDTPERVAAFLAQIGHETGGLRWIREIWGPTAAQARYEGRADLGNTQPGDGFKFRGRGLIHTTGRANYTAVTRRLRERLLDVPDFTQNPPALEAPKWAAYSAADYWDMRGINAAADAGDFERATRLVNGGLNGYEDRLARLVSAQQVIS